MKKVKSAFTLAEVLITLGIIGVVAAMTIPSLVQGQKDRATVTSLKKAYTTLSQAYISAVQDNGSPETWDFSSPSNVLNILTPYLKIQNNCPLGVSGCMYKGTYQFLKKTPWTAFTSLPKVTLLDGSALTLNIGGFTNCSTSRGSTHALQNICAEIYIDINSEKQPNIFGQDAFFFYLTRDGIIPAGSSREGTYNFGSHCRDATNADGFGCTAWALYNENLDYLRCNNLSWTGPTKCN